ncbi:MAG: dihydrolipoyl dehydrogenase [Polyangiales bacterium]
MTDKSYDAIVVGGGPGGYVAAIRLGQLGQQVLVVEREYMGGVCLNWGCIPSKALISAASLVDRVRHGETMGVTVSGINVDVAKLQAWKNGIVKKLTGGVASLVKSNGGAVVMGHAKLTGAHTVLVVKEDGKTESYVARKAIVVATGATPIKIPGFDVDGKVVITAREAVSLPQVPKQLVLIGGGIIGMELGMMYQKLGAKVTVVEMMPQILPGIDPEAVRVVQKRFVDAGGEVLVNAKASGCKVQGGKATVSVELDGKSREVPADIVLVAVGFRPNSIELGLAECGVKTDERGHVVVNERLQTNVSGVYAIGDVTGGPYLAHRAMVQGEVVAEVIAGKRAVWDVKAMPSAVFTDPEIATVGLSESDAKAQGKSIKVGKAPFAVSGRAMAIGEAAGFVKTIVDAQDHHVLGVTIVGPEASDLISEGSLAVEMGAYAEDVALTVHPHPTLSESLNESFKHALKEAVHIMNK